MQYLVTKMTTVLFCVVNSRGAGYMEFFYRLAERKYFYLYGLEFTIFCFNNVFDSTNFSLLQLGLIITMYISKNNIFSFDFHFSFVAFQSVAF
jgi:hypothetical protein